MYIFYFIEQLNVALDSDKQSQRSLLVVINPFSGRKRAVKDFNNVVSPMLSEASIKKCQTIITKSKSHVADIVDQLDVNSVTELVLFGGDGLLHEILNIINSWEESRKCEFLDKISFGVLAGGSSNSVCAALLIERGWHGRSKKLTVENSAFLLIKGYHYMYQNGFIYNLCNNLPKILQDYLKLLDNYANYATY